MPIGRIILAHMTSVLIGSLLLFAGLETIVAGPTGILQAIGKWIGGALIFLLISVASIPIGMVFRWAIGKLPMKPINGALLGGAIIGVALLFIIHPAMYPQMSFGSHPLPLTIVHLFAGISAGWLWYLIELGPEEKLGE